MRWWEPDPEEPQLLAWWRPLMAAARRLREEEVPWPVHLDEFALVARADRHPRPDVWVYRHQGSGGALCTDARGRTNRFVPDRAGRPRFTEIDARRAVWMAGLPDAVAPVWYEAPGPPPEPWPEADAAGDGGGAGYGRAPTPTHHRRVARRGHRHLRLVTGTG
jgi:hypothetical protein